MLRSLFPITLLIVRLDPPPPTPADFTICAPVNNGPIARPDHYGTNLYARKPDLA